jgi:hypothetical protein
MPFATLNLVQMEDAALTPSHVREAFRDPIPVVKITAGYRIQLIAVLLGMIGLQALYLALIVAVAILAAVVTMAAWGAQLSFNWVTFLFYVGPSAVGAIVTLFLLKPLVIRPPKPPEPVQLSRVQQPLLFDFVDCLCGAMGSPRPRRIFVDLRSNASASVHGWRGFFLGHLDLTIGLPLVVGLTLP